MLLLIISGASRSRRKRKEPPKPKVLCKTKDYEGEVTVLHNGGVAGMWVRPKRGNEFHLPFERIIPRLPTSR
jgi:hypothetical protein